MTTHANPPSALTSADLIERLFKAAFDVPRNPRSEEYKAGARAVLDYRVSQTRIICPHAAGSAQFDAFHAGVTEGHHIWRMYSEAPEHWQAGVALQLAREGAR